MGRSAAQHLFSNYYFCCSAPATGNSPDPEDHYIQIDEFIKGQNASLQFVPVVRPDVDNLKKKL